MFGSYSKSDSDRKQKNFTSSKINSRGKNWFWTIKIKYHQNLKELFLGGLELILEAANGFPNMPYKSP